MSKYPEIDAVLAGKSDGCIIHGDCLGVMTEMPDGCVDAVVTDPPYGVRKKEAWDDREQFLNLIVPSIDTCLRAARAGVCWFCSGNMLPWILVDREDSFHRLLVWNKPPGTQFAGASNNNLWYSSELILVFDGGTITSRGKESRQGYSVFDARTTPEFHFGHPTVKPISLMEWLVSHYSDPNDIILDPFCGSGTTCVAAKKLGRRWIGIEVDEGYCKTSRDRVSRTKKNLF